MSDPTLLGDVVRLSWACLFITLCARLEAQRHLQPYVLAGRAVVVALVCRPEPEQRARSCAYRAVSAIAECDGRVGREHTKSVRGIQPLSHLRDDPRPGLELAPAFKLARVTRGPQLLRGASRAPPLRRNGEREAPARRARRHPDGTACSPLLVPCVLVDDACPASTLNLLRTGARRAAAPRRSPPRSHRSGVPPRARAPHRARAASALRCVPDIVKRHRANA